LLQGNSYLSQQGSLQNARIAGRQGYSTVLSGTSPITRRAEVVTVYTVQLQNGQTFYVASVAPQQNSTRYNNTFRTMLNSIRLNDAN